MRPSGLRAINVSMSVLSKSMAYVMWYSSMSFRSLALFKFGQLLVEGSHAAPYIPTSCTYPIPHGRLGSELWENAIRVLKLRLVQWRICVLKTSVPSIFHDVWLFVGVVEPDSNIVYVPHFPPSLGGHV